jgi:hypothetical protein
MIFSLTDLFLIGLALDLSGAYLLGKGLLMSPALVNVLEADKGESRYLAEEAPYRNRIDAEIGLIYLAAGFAFQVVGYLLEVGGVHGATGPGRFIVAAGLGLGTLVAAWGCHRWLYPHRLDRFEARVIADYETR